MKLYINHTPKLMMGYYLLCKYKKKNVILRQGFVFKHYMH